MDDNAFLRSSEIFILAPQNTEAETHKLFAEANTNGSTDFLDIKAIDQRSLLYFDELLSIYIVLRTPLQPPSGLQKITERLSISLELKAKGTASSEAREEEDVQLELYEDVIWTGTLVATEQPIVIPSSDEENNARAEGYMIAVWECKALLNRPKIQLHRPVIVFNATATLQPAKSRTADSRYDPYLHDCQPAPENILAPLSKTFSRSNAVPSLPSTRLHRLRPLETEIEPMRQTLQVHAPDPFQALPAVSSRLRHHQGPENTRNPTLLLSLETVLAPFSCENIELAQVTLESARGIVEDLGQDTGPRLPLQCRPKDNVVFLYRLSIDEASSVPVSADSNQIVLVNIKASVLVSDTCKPKIRMQWSTAVDLAASFRLDTLLQPSSLHQDKHASGASLKMPTTTLKSGGVGAVVSQHDGTSNQSHIPITFSAPTTIQLQKQFHLEIFVVNKSKSPRRLILTPLDRSGNQWNTPSQEPKTRAETFLSAEVAVANVGEQDLQTIIGATNISAPEIIPLDSRLELPNLDPGGCYAARLRLLPLSSGHIQLGGFSVTDELSSSYYEIYEMPNVLVVE